MTMNDITECVNCFISCSSGTELFPQNGISQYVDPSNYGDPMEAVRTFAAEIDRSQIKLECRVGGGVYHDKLEISLFLTYHRMFFKVSNEKKSNGLEFMYFPACLFDS